MHKYTDAEDTWLRENIDRYTYTDLTRAFNARFGTNVKSIADHCTKALGLHKSIELCSIKGKRICKNVLPVGSERMADGSLWVKVGDQVNDCKNRRMPDKRHDVNWVRKDELIYGPVPEGKMLIHLNMNPLDCRRENLYAVTRQVGFMMSKNRWYTTNAELTLTAIKYCELFYAMKGTKK